MAEKNIDYKTLNAELDELMTQLQSDDLDVDEALKLYERGMTITKQLESYLKKAENTIQKVKSDWESHQ